MFILFEKGQGTLINISNLSVNRKKEVQVEKSPLIKDMR